MLVSKRGIASRTASTSYSSSKRPQVLSVALSSRVAFADWDDSRKAGSSLYTSSSQGVSSGAPKKAATTMMGNKASGGPFSPLVVVVRNAMGEKDFNKFRGKAISVHSQVIKDFCSQFGVDNKQVQGVIRLAKKNGEKLGFLA
ncbi:hypothetical protein CEUSTIGMA_g8081.t1 [Chlamydomonas eustigma]|uniref:Uncharacterized protein n=1 Tax=Chlamydomonas eustigma TaxID=1157962 RepID=A0A250XC66_9CHLO|nr:hypothetical protein CEUSTIGMA_g8081.t1 [Chlamydomonas eustigma]|eukprot:GAX80646.1 hypothetical protein CEUSTIGMA_g8081.t1 [Chlamydomonas eustigma]